MSTIDTSTWSPDSDLNVEIEGIPLNANASIQQTWQAIQMLMAALKGDTAEIKLTINQPDGTTIVATNQTLTVVDNGHAHTIANVTGLQTALNGKASTADMTGATASADGASGLVPKPLAGDQDKVLKGDGTWGTLSVSDIPNIDASKIASGTIDLARLPAGALERLVTVADQTARFALTTASVQLGDTVKQLDTGAMYIVVDTAKLNQAAGYVEYTAGSAASVPWSGVTGKPSTFTPSSHSHGSITNDGKLGTASRVVVTDGSKVIGVSPITTTKLGYLTDVTANIQGQIDGKADSATTLAGYGITDAKIANGTITLGSSSITPLTSHQSLDGKMTRGSYERIEGTSSAHKDLNNYTIAGFYNIKTQYVDNCPTGIGIDAVLLIYPWNFGSYCTQEITESAASGDTRRWVRKLNNTVWSAWKQIAFTNTTLAGYGITDAYTKTEIDTKLTSAMHYKGSVATYADLPSSGNVTGDFYNVTATGENYAWTGSAWDATGSIVDLAAITNTEIDTVVAS